MTSDDRCFALLQCSPFPCYTLQPWIRDYDKLQSLAVVLIYVQIGCALLGSLGALYNGVLLINLGIALFAIVAIESGSQTLGRTYAVLLFSAILLDVLWFILFTNDIWNISSDKYGVYVIFSVRLTLAMEIIGFSVRLASSFLWIQMYRLGVSYLDGTVPQETDSDLRISFLNPSSPAVARQTSGCNDVVGGAIYDPAYYSSLFEDNQDNGYAYGGHKFGAVDSETPSMYETSQLLPSSGRSLLTVHEKKAGSKSFVSV